MGIAVFGALDHTDLPVGTKVQIKLNDDTEVRGRLRAPIAVGTIREGLSGYYLYPGQLSISLKDVVWVEVLSFPEPKQEAVDNWPDGTVLVRPSSGPNNPASVYVKDGKLWRAAGRGSMAFTEIPNRHELLVYGPTGAKLG